MADKPQMLQPEHYDTEDDEGRVVGDADIHALTQLNAAEINQQIMTARAYPRSVTGFRRSMREMVTYDQPTALSCLYALKRSGKVIEGPSIRFAEAALQSWGNARAGSRIVDVGEQFVTAQGFFYDLEKNMAVAIEVMRRITNSNGERYGEDLIGVTGNAAGSIALRNAILRGVPKTAWNESYQEARHLSIGKGESITVKREEMMKAFAPLGVDKEQVFGLLGIKGIEDVSVDHMIFMGGIFNAIKEGETTVEKEFAAENMANPGQVAPRRPKQSEFKRDQSTGPHDSAKGLGGKPEGQANNGAGPSAQTGGSGGAGGTAKTEVNPAEQKQPETKSEAGASAFEDWYADQKKAVAEALTVRVVTDIRDETLREVEGFPEKEKEFIALCEARTKEILEAKKAKR
jgi:hypothetical protein